MNPEQLESENNNLKRALAEAERMRESACAEVRRLRALAGEFRDAWLCFCDVRLLKELDPPQRTAADFNAASDRLGFAEWALGNALDPLSGSGPAAVLQRLRDRVAELAAEVVRLEGSGRGKILQ